MCTNGQLDNTDGVFAPYNRAHRGLDGTPPDEQSEITDRKIARLDDYRWEKRCRGVYQLPVAA